VRHAVKGNAVKEGVGNASSAQCTDPKQWVASKKFKYSVFGIR
jgi:hypothetical protein